MTIWLPHRTRLGLMASAFDPLHPGHLWAMRQAIEDGACEGILAALHIDPSIERPTKRKPAMTADERALILTAIRYVRFIRHYQTEDELLAAIKNLRPCCLIIGEDHKGETVTGGDFGIPIFWAKRKPEWSGTAFAHRIAESLRCRS